MILLEPSSKIVEETVKEKLSGEVDRSSSTVLADFDGVTYRISTEKGILLVSLAWKCFKELENFGARNVLAREYGAYYRNEAEPGYDVTLQIDLQSLPADLDGLAKACALLKRHSMAAPFEIAFQSQSQGKDSPLMQLNYRDDEAIYIKSQEDRVTVIFSTEFKEETDQVYGKVFLQEFVDARRQPAIQNAPQVLYTVREPPLDLRGLPNLKDSEKVGYVTFVLFPRHFQGNAAYDCISKIELFRDYFHFHIKASKAYLHSRMRARVDSLLKVLNRAKPEVPTEQKTATGRAFKRN